MTCEHTERWMTIISEDLRDARRDLPGRTGEPAAFLRERIAENEAILRWLQRSQHAGGSSDRASALGYAIGDRVRAV